MRMTRRQFFYVVGVGGLVAACSPTGQPEPDFTVVMHRDRQFQPASLIVPQGSMVAWQNRADHVHTVTADPALAQQPQRVLLPAGAETFDSGDVFSGERWAYTFETVGLYTYFCRYHEQDEMIGSIRVVAV